MFNSTCTLFTSLCRCAEKSRYTSLMNSSRYSITTSRQTMLLKSWLLLVRTTELNVYAWSRFCMLFVCVWLYPGYINFFFIIIFVSGTGKTTTLVKYAQQRPHLRFLYISFNKSVAMEANRSFPSNVECRTIHSMAYKAIGHRWVAKEFFFFISFGMIMNDY